MKITKKLMAVRNDLQGMSLSKSGHNKFATLNLVISCQRFNSYLISMDYVT